MAGPRRRRRAPPKTGGARFSAEVRDLSSQGHGVVTAPDGLVCFVPGVWIGERGEFEVLRKRGSVAQARLVTLENPSPERREPPCAHHGSGPDACGGCPWQFVDYTAQASAKETRVHQALERLMDKPPIAPILRSPRELGYRNRAQLKSDGQHLGYMAAGSNRIVDIDNCPVLNSNNAGQLVALRGQLPNRAWKPDRRRDFVSLHIDDDTDPRALAVNERRPFRQGNDEQNQRMREWLAGELASLDSPPSGPAVELYAGSGNLTEILVAAGFNPITAIDSFAPAIETLGRRSLPGVSGLCARLEDSPLAPTITDALREARLLLLDPPRSGAPAIGEMLAAAKRLSDIIYISCDLATYGRDLKALMGGGFELVKVQPMDMYPQTPHIELLTRLRRR